MLMKAGSRLFHKPYGLGGLGLLTGFLKGYMEGIPQIEDKALIKYLRKEQLKRVCFQRSLWS
jgi:hypothetical protein